MGLTNDGPLRCLRINLTKSFIALVLIYPTFIHSLAPYFLNENIHPQYGKRAIFQNVKVHFQNW